MSLGRCHSLVRIRHREPLQLYTHLASTPYVRPIFVSCQKCEDGVKVDTMLHDVHAGIPYNPSRIHHRPDSRPAYRKSLVRPFARIYTLLPTNELYILSCFLALLIVDEHSECPLGTPSLLTCNYAPKFVLCSLHVLMSMCHFLAPLLVAHGPLSP